MSSFGKLSVVIIICLLFVPPLCAEFILDPIRLNQPISLAGYVISPEGVRVPAAAVRILETGQRTMSDGNGRFSFNEIWYGEVTFEISSKDYEQASSGRIDLINRQGLLELKFENLRSFAETIVITATREERLLKDVPVRTEVITADFIEKKAAVTLADAIEATAGLRVQNNCQNCGFNSLRINGLDGNYSHVLLNGLPAFSSLASVYGLEQIPTVMVDRIEVIKGGASALYGPSAVGGVVNVITKRPATNSLSLETVYSNMDGENGGGLRGFGSWTSRSGRTALFTYGNIVHAAAYDRNGDGFSDIAYKSLNAVGARLFQRMLNDTAELEIGLDFTYEDRKGGENKLDGEPHETSLAEWVESTRTSVSAKWHHFLGGGANYTVHLIHAYTDRDTYYGAGYDPNAYGTTSNPNTNIAAYYSHSLARHNLQYGLQYERDRITDEHPGFNWVTHGEFENYGAYVQDDFKLNNRLSLLLGGRVDKHSLLSDPVFSPRLSVMLSPGENIRVRATFSQGFKAPAVFDEDLHIELSGGEPRYQLYDPQLKEERASSFSLSAEYSADSALRLEGNLFYTTINDTFVNELVSSDDDPVRLFMRVNGGSSKVYGLEVNADLELPAGFDLKTGWTFQRSRFDQPEPEFGSLNFFSAPNVYGYAMGTCYHSRFTASLGLEVNGGMWVPHYAGWIDDDRLELVDSYYTLNAKVDIPLVRGPYALNLLLNIYNINDYFQDDLDIGPDRDAGWIYGPRRPRTFSFGLKLDL
ncbi:MAG TPA: TonB-dependent receptor [Acidobacteriota bacterium]|nr:TonB-dependent receptor [Acidobacteriota bacterium]